MPEACNSRAVGHMLLMRFKICSMFLSLMRKALMGGRRKNYSLSLVIIRYSTLPLVCYVPEAKNFSRGEGGGEQIFLFAAMKKILLPLLKKKSAPNKKKLDRPLWDTSILSSYSITFCRVPHKVAVRATLKVLSITKGVTMDHFFL